MELKKNMKRLFILVELLVYKLLIYGCRDEFYEMIIICVDDYGNIMFLYYCIVVDL